MALPIFKSTRTQSHTITSILETFGRIKVSWLVMVCSPSTPILFRTLPAPLLLPRSTIPLCWSSWEGSKTPINRSPRCLLTSLEIIGNISMSKFSNTTVGKLVTTRTGLIKECGSGFLTISCLTPSFCSRRSSTSPKSILKLVRTPS